LNTPADDPWSTILAGSKKQGTAITIRNYAGMLRAKDQAGISQLIDLRFRERYLNPAVDNPKRNGFAMLAICCLMVEALESFRNGWKKTNRIKGGGEAVFRGFFDQHEEFKDLRPVANEFYKHIRCGILHQAETSGRWLVNRRGTLFSQAGGVQRLSASVFAKRLGLALDTYVEDLATAPWKDPVWKKARRKLREVCRNCGLPDAQVARLE
jgi:hypothetical protein